MNPALLQRALVCLHYDPLLATHLTRAPAELGTLLGLGSAELAALLEIDVRAFRADRHRGDRLLTVLAEQFSATLTLLRLSGWSPRSLPEFLSSSELRGAILSRSSTTAAFATWLSSRTSVAHDGRSSALGGPKDERLAALTQEVCAVEAAVASSRAARADRRAYEAMLEQKAVTRGASTHPATLRLAPWCVVVHASLGAVELVSQIHVIMDDVAALPAVRRTDFSAAGAAPTETSSQNLSKRLEVVLGQSSQLPRVRRAVRLTKASDEAVAQLVEQSSYGEASISALSDALARLLLDAAIARPAEALRASVVAVGASEGDARALLQDLVGDGVLVPGHLTLP